MTLAPVLSSPDKFSSHGSPATHAEWELFAEQSNDSNLWSNSPERKSRSPRLVQRPNPSEWFPDFPLPKTQHKIVFTSRLLKPCSSTHGVQLGRKQETALKSLDDWLSPSVLILSFLLSGLPTVSNAPHTMQAKSHKNGWCMHVYVSKCQWEECPVHYNLVKKRTVLSCSVALVSHRSLQIVSASHSHSFWAGWLTPQTCSFRNRACTWSMRSPCSGRGQSLAIPCNTGNTPLWDRDVFSQNVLFRCG